MNQIIQSAAALVASLSFLACSLAGGQTTTTTTTTTTTSPPVAKVPPMPMPPHPIDHQIILPNIHGHPVWSPRGNPVELSTVDARVEIVDQIATTSLELSLHNPANQPQEAVLVFPVPDGVAIRSLQYDGVGPEPTAKLLARDDARRIYSDIVRSMRDPALVEFVGLNLIQTSVFPIPANATQKLTLKFEEALAADGNRIDYALLRSNSFAAATTKWTISADIRSKQPINTIYSPSHAVTLKNESANHAIVRIDGSGAETGTVRISYITAPSDGPAFTVFACPDTTDAGGKSGYFMILGGVSSDARLQPPRREVVLVIDRSGSMRGEKIKQAQNAATSVIDGLLDGESFNIIDYSDSVRTYADKPVVKTAQTAKEAKLYISEIKAEGGTNIHDALIEAMRPQPADGFLPMTLFLTDGLPTIGERSETKIREAIASANKFHRRIFTFGVGLDVNTPLLSGLATVSRATSTFILPEEDVELKVSRVFKGLAGPVLESPRLTIIDDGGQPTSRRIQDVQPADLPDYFDGDQVMILGAYNSNRPMTLHLDGTIRGRAQSFDIHLDPAAASLRHDYVPRLWAARRIAALIDQVRQAGADGSTPMADARMKEVTDEIVRLSTKFGVLTEYTAFLAKEETRFGDADGRQLHAQVRLSLDSRAAGGRTGAGAVNQEQNINTLKDAGKPMAAVPADAPGRSPFRDSGTSGGGFGAAKSLPPAAMPSQSKNKQSYLDDKLQNVEITSVRQIGDQTFYNRQNRWVDARILDKETEKPDRTVTFGTPEYLTLAETLAKTNQQHLLSQDGDILLLVGNERVLVQMTEK